MSAMTFARVNWAALYRIGFTPWDAFTRDADLIELIEGPDRLPPGRALDIGCGRGRNSIYLASHGWDVTGVDLVQKALTAARRRAAAAGHSIRFLAGDVMDPDGLGIGAGYNLLVDFGCFHSLSPRQRIAYAEAVTRLAAPDALLWMWSFGSRDSAGKEVPPGQVAAGFPGWELIGAGEISRDEIDRTMAGLPMLLRPVRVPFRRGWFPPPFRAKLRLVSLAGGTPGPDDQEGR